MRISPMVLWEGECEILLLDPIVCNLNWTA
jgi:hypothetical protein